jgi:hypothetical protein
MKPSDRSYRDRITGRSLNFMAAVTVSFNSEALAKKQKVNRERADYIKELSSKALSDLAL